MVPRSWGWFKMLLSSSSFVFKRIDPFSLCRLFILNFLFKTRLGIDRVQSSLLTSDVRWRLYEGCHQRRLKLRLWFFYYEFREGNEETCSDPLPRRRTGFGASIMITLLLILENPTCPIYNWSQESQMHYLMWNTNPPIPIYVLLLILLCTWKWNRRHE